MKTTYYDLQGRTLHAGSMFYDHRTLAGRYARFLARLLPIKTGTQRHMDRQYKAAGMRPLHPWKL